MAKAGSTFTGEMPEQRVPRGERLFLVKWGEDRQLEMMVGGTLVIFPPHGTQTFTEAMVNSPEFQNVKNHFGVVEA